MWGQEFQISGEVRQTNGQNIAFANLVLLHASDSSFVTGTASDENGFFAFNNIAPNAYFLQASYIGNSSPFRRIELTSNTSLETIFLDNEIQELHEVVVVSNKPTVVKKVDRLVFNIENTALSESDIWEVLKNTPSVFVMNEKITVKGESGVQIYINDKRVQLPQSDVLQLLSGTGASAVQAIEVISAPPAKYDAEGGAIINIKMKKNLVSGYNGAVFNRYEQGVFPQQMLGTNHYFKGKKLETSFNYSFGQEKFLTRYTDVTYFMDQGNVRETWTSYLESIDKRKKHTASVFLDYPLDDNNTLAFSSIASLRPLGNARDFSDTRIQEQDTPNGSGFYTNIDSESEGVNTAFYLDYIRKLNPEGARLSFNSHLTYYQYEREQLLSTDFYDNNRRVANENDFSTTNDQQTNLYSLQTDYQSPIGEKSTLETGLKYALINSESRIDQVGFDRDQPGIDPTEKGVFLYDEHIWAAYASFQTQGEKWSLKSGLRAEYTETTSNFSQLNKKVKKDYLELFPSLYLRFAPHDNHQWGLSVKRSIARPSYDKVNPFQVFQSNNSVVEGNMDLQPSFKHSAIFSYTYQSDYTFELFYRYHTNIIRLLTFQDNEYELLRFRTSNVDRELAYGSDFIYNKGVAKFWDTYFLASYFYSAERFVDLDSQQKIDQGLWTLLVKWNNNFSLLKDKSLSGNINFMYVSPIIRGNSRQEKYNEWEISLKKTVFGKRGILSMGLTDVFKQFNLRNTRKYGNQYNTSVYRPDGRIFSLGFRYKFGNLGIKDNYRSKNVEERNRL
ncbi:Outer membrane receptor proteins, mostly Fe transport [Arenibacter nanhaiticus]|uniref:Outer membrane receptor proteins, mostly Fe transport n=2 Tax=Arenibacter nanhaiticus TaxID=558155 RepID=A0A1M6LV59_9FLAO|nr:Outer membrane receptor proteins, mostly Fe transport [Arenibacter nanhaiticus]